MLLNRLDSAGFKRFVSLGKALLSKGASLLVFPEGTRSVDGRLKEFKKVRLLPLSPLGRSQTNHLAAPTLTPHPLGCVHNR